MKPFETTLQSVLETLIHEFPTAKIITEPTTHPSVWCIRIEKKRNKGRAEFNKKNFLLFNISASWEDIFKEHVKSAEDSAIRYSESLDEATMNEEQEKEFVELHADAVASMGNLE